MSSEGFEPLTLRLERFARDFPHATAVLSESGDWTYERLVTEMCSVGAALEREDPRGLRAILVAAPGPLFLSGFLGCLAVGAIPVPLPWPTGPAARKWERFLALARNARPSFLIGEPSQLIQAAPKLGEIADDRGERPRMVSLPTVASMGPLRHRPDPAEVAFLQYTSGSTQEPRGVVISHEALYFMLERIREIVAVDQVNPNRPPFTTVTWLPPHHDMGLVGMLLAPMHLGAPVRILDPRRFLEDPLDWLESLALESESVGAAPNFALALVAERAQGVDLGHLDLSRCRRLVCGAEPVHASTIDSFLETVAPCGFRPEALTPSYGLAEATLVVTRSVGPRVLECDGRALGRGEIVPGSGRRIVSSGSPIEGVEIMIIDPETGIGVPDGRLGEVCVGGPGLASGYWRRPEETARVFGTRCGKEGKPLARTGDLGALFHGELYVADRLKDLVVIRGAKYHPVDIEEATTSSHEAVVTAVAFAVQREGLERLVLMIERRVGEVPDADLESRIRGAVLDAHGLSVFGLALLRRGQLPRTTSGKVQRARCREMFEAGKWAPGLIDPGAVATASPEGARPENWRNE